MPPNPCTAPALQAVLSIMEGNQVAPRALAALFHEVSARVTLSSSLTCHASWGPHLHMTSQSQARN